ncbi:hypothetical protein BDV37DRAFT_247982 [Aspergillus pseudonomiae]|uniref:Uncharacterized protein n=1 Tax=Aspergillus pseudonomiae TaxID=1506151 RepID=A0A5N7DDI5_9EURO|nr:uncharacterized protein BDV37DRAFT_247982 [Aspergillus pseudonomiae]KAE8404235.1 hypothetical protein BDV37DRAFT_247982 [Aspergillus pseudonomiae]
MAKVRWPFYNSGAEFEEVNSKYFEPDEEQEQQPRIYMSSKPVKIQCPPVHARKGLESRVCES